MNILIADDHLTNLKLLRAILETEGHQVFSAIDGVEALGILDKEKVDAVISDILMPRMDGYRLCQEVRQSETLNHLPFIIYTATYTSASDEGLALKVGADGYLRKPAKAETLLEMLHRVCSSPRSGPSVVPPEGQDVMREYSEALVRKLEHKNAELERAQAEIIKANEELEQRVRDRTAELEAANEELEAFSYSAAHDLRAPLRVIDGFCQMLFEDQAGELGTVGIDYLRQIQGSTRKMNSLIEELLKLSYIGRCDTTRLPINLTDLVIGIGEELRRAHPVPQTELVVEQRVLAEGDEPLLRIALENLLTNAWKFTRRQGHPRIEFGSLQDGGSTVYFLRDNGVGFDAKQAENLFEAFRRMHTQLEFPGTGLGLTIVRRIIARHGGSIWADSQLGQGATFYFKL